MNAPAAKNLAAAIRLHPNDNVLVARAESPLQRGLHRRYRLIDLPPARGALFAEGNPWLR
jgi:hypothetical protein